MDVNQEDLCWAELRFHAPKSISWNHYDLAAKTEIHDVNLWKEFLQTREVIDWLNEERIILQTYELAKLSTNVSDSRSVGQAQLISAMGKVTDANRVNAATGPIFIYSYVPLNAEQRHAPNVQELTEDIFYVPAPELILSPDVEGIST